MTDTDDRLAALYYRVESLERDNTQLLARVEQLEDITQKDSEVLKELIDVLDVGFSKLAKVD